MSGKFSPRLVDDAYVPDVVETKGRGTPPGGGEPPDMEKRIEALEAGQKSMTAQLADISATLREISAKLDAKADAATLERVAGEVRNSLTGFEGRLSNLGTVGDGLRRDLEKLPSKFDVATIIVFVVGGLAGIATLIKTVWPHVFGG
jgi:hypothetical protein